MRKRAPKPPNEKLKAYAEGRASGKSRRESALVAGLSPISVAIKEKELKPGIMAALSAEAKKNIKLAGGITREEVIQGLIDAANMGRIEGDPMSMIAAYRELGKLCGFYAPEVKKIEHELGANTLAALENLSDAELMRISKGRVLDVTDAVMIEDKSGSTD